MRNPNDAGNRFARNGIIFAIVVLVIILICYAYLHYAPRSAEPTAMRVPSVPAQEANITDPVKGMECHVPKVVNPMANYTIVAGNVAVITMGSTFSGENITFTVSAKPGNAKNAVTIDAKTGVVRVKAEATDTFDVKVTANNACGSVSDIFNVEVDEDS